MFAQFRPNVEKEAPKINITGWLKNIPSDQNIKNKTVVLNFWPSFNFKTKDRVSHVNNLVKELASRNVYFITLTNKSSTKTNSFLKKNPLKSIITNDITGITIDSYKDAFENLASMPFSVVINPDNKIVWYGSILDLDSDSLTEVMYQSNNNITQDKRNKNNVKRLG